MALTAAEWRAHLGITGWRHEDGTICPTSLAPATHERLWCTEHQQHIAVPEDAAAAVWEQHKDNCPTCGLGRKQDGIWDDLCDVGRRLKDAAKASGMSTASCDI
jgi:hypothetical protein